MSVFNIYFSRSFHILFLTDQMKGFASIFQLLGRYKRRISMVLQPDVKTRDKQHVRLAILHKLNLEVHKPRTRKIYSNLYLSDPLLRIIEPHWRNIEPHCGIIEPL